jgi:Ser-tRNA(Ala) deacylase AlaX
MEIHTAEKLVSENSPFEFKIVIAKFKKYKSSGSIQIWAEMIQAGSETLRSEIYKLINSICSKEELPDQ